jgi:signal transduction histidine kinase
MRAFVRDRGKGFDPETVAPDRRGLAESVRGRITRLGGTAEIESAAGEGTEIRLFLPAAVDAAP